LSASPQTPPGDAPGTWLRELVRAKPAAWQWGRSLRAGVCIAAPCAAGFALDAMATWLWIAMGALMAAVHEPAGSYRYRVRQIVAACSLGALGLLAGYLDALPFAWVVLVMAVLAFAAGLVSNLGSTWSIGSMLILQLAAVAIGVPSALTFWKVALLFLAGVALHVAMLLVEQAVAGGVEQRKMLASIPRALATLARVRRASLAQGDGASVEGERELAHARAGVTDAMTHVGRAMGEAHAGSPAGEADWTAALLLRADAAFAAIMATDDRDVLDRYEQRLAAAAATMPRTTAIETLRTQAGRAPDAPDASGSRDRPDSSGPPDSSDSPVTDLLDTLATRDAGALVARARRDHAARDGAHSFGPTIARLKPGRRAVRSAFALGLCIGIAYTTRWAIDASHWYWVPLTVAVVMKPDLGSVFARSVQRSLGTIAGVELGVVLLVLLPKGPWLVLAMGILGALLPWAKRRSYVLQTLLLTPLLLILLDLVVPGTETMDFGAQRMADTVIGATIVLIFGYFIWPRTHPREIWARFRKAKCRIGEYLMALCDADAARVSAARRAAYADLEDLRGRLDVALVEPPPASSEAMAWFPLIATAERLCDHVTAYSVARPTPSREEADALRELARYVEATPAERAQLTFPAADDTGGPLATLVAAVRDDLAHLSQLSRNEPFARERAART